jgi:hypothetical protein
MGALERPGPRSTAAPTAFGRLSSLEDTPQVTAGALAGSKPSTFGTVLTASGRHG